ncbi:carbohydrate-binding module family 24 protein [Parathielavia appendiculata]|uniref:Carbohydrate-binding module family 24 protein n=1 Tax=Parathielavia appendiculata TaxID=2587402 RepID=A0AAN6YYG9_9PEZI|nr:carbohydrate-binding module family 24 protein [Parathielavia appendiculata]
MVGITTALPASLLPAYWSYASSAWSRRSVHSSNAVRAAQDCPILWFETTNSESCNGGTNADGETHTFMGLCSFACSFRYFPPGPCKCTSYGAPGSLPPTNGRDDCPLPGPSDAYKSLCNYACNHG